MMKEIMHKLAKTFNKTIVYGFQLVGLYSVYMLHTQDSTWYAKDLVLIIALNAFTLSKVYSIGEKIDR